MTHRQYLAWMSWLSLEEREPSLSDYYAMQIAAEVRRVLSKNPNAIKMEDFKITFEVPGEKKASTQDQATLVEAEKAVWKHRLQTMHDQSKQRERRRIK